MGEKIYKEMKTAGVWNLILGIIIAAGGIAMGVIFIINGARLLKSKSEITF